MTIQNAWTGSAVATYDLDIIFNGICEGDCFDPNACNFVPDAELVNNDLCLYAIDLYPNGLYDCDGNCYLDFDGDGICNALEIPGCQEPWACNYNPAATDPPQPALPCVYLRPTTWIATATACSLSSWPSRKTQRSHATASLWPPASAQPAPAAVTYYGCSQLLRRHGRRGLLIHRDHLPGRLSQQLHHRPLLGITDCMGLQNAILQTITVVDNLPPVILTNLTTDTLDCNDPVIFEPSRLKIVQWQLERRRKNPRL